MSAPMFEQVKKSGICKTGSVLKGLILLICSYMTINLKILWVCHSNLSHFKKPGKHPPESSNLRPMHHNIKGMPYVDSGSCLRSSEL
jgi:hypothetical protein